MFLEIHQLWRTLPKFFSRSSSTCDANVKANSVLGAWIIQSVCLFLFNFDHSFLSVLSLLTQTPQLTGERLNRGHYESKMTPRPQPSALRTMNWEKNISRFNISKTVKFSVQNPLRVNTHIPLAHTTLKTGSLWVLGTFHAPLLQTWEVHTGNRPTRIKARTPAWGTQLRFFLSAAASHLPGFMFFILNMKHLHIHAASQSCILNKKDPFPCSVKNFKSSWTNQTSLLHTSLQADLCSALIVHWGINWSSYIWMNKLVGQLVLEYIYIQMRLKSWHSSSLLASKASSRRHHPIASQLIQSDCCCDCGNNMYSNWLIEVINCRQGTQRSYQPSIMKARFYLQS